MELFFFPFACSIAGRITAYESGADVRFVRIDPLTRRTEEGEDFLSINPMGQVPALRFRDGRVLTQNLAVLQAIADSRPESEVAQAMSGDRRPFAQQWLSFVASELHATVFHPLLSKTTSQDHKTFARREAQGRLAVLEDHLQDRDVLLDTFSVADAYLVAVLNWSRVTDLDLGLWPAVEHYVQRQGARAQVRRAFEEEMTLYREKRAP